MTEFPAFGVKAKAQMASHEHCGQKSNSGDRTKHRCLSLWNDRKSIHIITTLKIKRLVLGRIDMSYLARA
jgi:hypothetical protein